MVSRGLSIDAGAFATQWAAAALYRVLRVCPTNPEVVDLALGSQQYTVKIDGNAPARHHAQLVREGDFITIEGRSNPTQGVIRREDIRKMR